MIATGRVATRSLSSVDGCGREGRGGEDQKVVLVSGKKKKEGGSKRRGGHIGWQAVQHGPSGYCTACMQRSEDVLSAQCVAWKRKKDVRQRDGDAARSSSRALQRLSSFFFRFPTIPLPSFFFTSSRNVRYYSLVL